MADIEPRRGAGLSRRTKEQRAYRLVLAGGAAGVIAVAGVVLAVIGVVGAWLPLLAAVVAAICVILFRRTVS